MRGRRILLAVLVLGAGLALAPAKAASLVEVTGFGTNPGNLRMFKYVPDNLGSGKPLVAVLHGCTQTASSIDAESGWTAMAETHRFALVFPQQQSSNNSNSCFNWFEPGDQARGSGEPLSIKQMVDRMVADHGSDTTKVFIQGFSAGAAFASVMLATYPDVFRSGAIVAGVPYKCATTLSQAFSCMSPGVDKTPQQWGDLVRAAFTYGGVRPTVSIWHGTSDTTVVPLNMTELMQQWTNVLGVDQTADTSDTVKGYPHNVYRDAGGAAKVETYSITSMGHGQPIDPGAGADQCGTVAAYMLDVNICAAYFISSFWGLIGAPQPTPTPPPGGGATYANSDANDGYVKAFADGSSAAVGTLEGTYGLAIGRGTDAKFNRTVLSFDTSGIPDGATVTRAYVTVTYSTSSGDPWANPAGNTLVVDVKTGCFGACTIETGDWASGPTASAVATIAKFTSGTKASTDFAAGGLSAINKTGTTQLKLRFSLNQTATNYIFVKKGADATLTVEWG